MESYSSEISTLPASATWPPPSTEQSPVYEFKLNHAMIRVRSLGLYVYQPNFWRRKLEVSEHGFSGSLLRISASCLPWPDIEAITIARKRRQVCIAYSSHSLGFKSEVAQIFSLDLESFDLFGAATKRFAKCAVVEDDKIYWSYSKLVIWFSLFWLSDLSILLAGLHLSQWTSSWKHILGLLNHLVSINLP